MGVWTEIRLTDGGLTEGPASGNVRTHVHTQYIVVIHYHTVDVWHGVTALAFSPLLCAPSRSTAERDLSESLFNHRWSLSAVSMVNTNSEPTAP